MPNHVHAIIIINKPVNPVGVTVDDTIDDTIDDTVVETRLIASLPITEPITEPITVPINQPLTDPPTDPPTGTTPEQLIYQLTQSPKTGGFAGIKNPMLNDNLSRIIRWYKGRTTFESRKIHAGFAWQPRFHDHIVRNETSFRRIQNYISDNPINWKEDTFYE